MKKIIIFLLLILFNYTSLLFSQDNLQELFEKSLDNFKTENYSEAINNYEILVDNDVKNSTVYYNLSLSYLKNKDIGKASLNIERALRISPRDKQIIELKKYIDNLLNIPEPNIAEKIIYKVKYFASLNELTMLMVALFSLICILLMWFFISNKKIYLNIFFIVLVCFIPLATMFCLKYNEEILSKEAIVITRVGIRNKPIKTESPVFEIKEGRKVEILSDLGVWLNVKLSIEGLTGWIDKRSLELI